MIYELYNNYFFDKIYYLSDICEPPFFLHLALNKIFSTSRMDGGLAKFHLKW